MKLQLLEHRKRKTMLPFFDGHFPKWRPKPILRPKTETLIALTEMDTSGIVIHLLEMVGGDLLDPMYMSMHEHNEILKV